jgi:hypothetical protein
MFDNETDEKAYYAQLCYDADPKALYQELDKAIEMNPSPNFDHAWYVAVMWGQGDRDAMDRIYRVAKSLK